MKREPRIQARLLLPVGFALLLLTSAALANGVGPEISRYVIGGGGHSEAGSFVLDATAGQPVAGAVNAGQFELCVGFWCGMGEYRVRLPVVLRN